MGVINWGSDPSWTTETITLNSQTDGTVCLATSDVNNATDRDMLLEVELVLGSINPTGAPFVELHVRPRLSDGSTFADCYAGGPTMVSAMRVTTGSSVKNLLWAPPTHLIFIRPGISRLAIVNRTGQTFAGSGNALRHRRYTLNAA
jgi:hypothetical protein